MLQGRGGLRVLSSPLVRLLLQSLYAGKLGRAKRGNLRRSHIGFVFQFHRLLPEFSALENVMIPQMLNGLDRNEAATRAEQLLAMVGLQARADPWHVCGAQRIHQYVLNEAVCFSRPCGRIEHQKRCFCSKR